MALTRVKQNYQITIPYEVRQKLRIELGDVFEVTVQHNSILLTPKVVVVMDKKSSDETLKDNIKRGVRSRKAF